MNWLARTLRLKLNPIDAVAAMPIPQATLSALRCDDQFVVSYPRSGNTWLLGLISDLIRQQRYGMGLDGIPPLGKWNRVVADLHIQAPDAPGAAEFGLERRILKSHNILDLRGRRMVYIFRQAADALVSYFHLHLRRSDWGHENKEDIERFCRKNLGGWCRHMELALAEHERNPENVLFIAYERMLADGVTELERCARFLGFPVERSGLTAAVERHSFERSRQKEEENPENPKEFFFRKGKEGSAREELSSQVFEWISAQAGGWYDDMLSRAR